MKFILFSILTLCISCSSADLKKLFSGKEDTSKRNKELMKDFEVEEDVMDKFEVKKQAEASEQKETPTKVTPPKKSSEPVKPKVKVAKKITKKKATPKPKVVNPKGSTKRKTLAKKELEYPEGTPEEFKDYDAESKTYWHLYKPTLVVGEKAIFSIKYGIIDTGTISIETLAPTVMGDDEVFHVRARVKTSDYYSYLYELDDVTDSYIKKSNFIPLKFSLIQRESSQDVDDLQLFDHEKLKIYSFYKRVTKSKTKKRKKTLPIPHYFQDPLSVMYFIRGLPLDSKKEFQIPIVNKGKVEMLTAKPQGTETIQTKIGKKAAYKVKINSQAKGKTIKGGDMTFWFSTDPSRVFLKFKAEIKIGSISGEVIEYKRP